MPNLGHPKRKRATRIVAILIVCYLPPVACFAEPPAEPISFNRDIRPILSDRCYYCHGFDENHRAADLRLDLRDDAEWVLEPGSPDDSELMRRILSEDADEVMPPPGAHKQAITAHEANLIRRWIKQGAEYEAHWAFIPLTKPETTVVLESPEKAIDYFVGKRLDQEGLAPSPPTTPSKWLRRAALDLTGLPPTVEQMRHFDEAVRREGESAYARATDRLLASEHFGERLALEWLDVARYADTNGFQRDAYRMNWPWRDWVVDAINRDMPMDQFIIEQLAGDLLGSDTEAESSIPEGHHRAAQNRLIATAFNRNHMINGEGGAIIAENLAKNNFDRVETFGTAMMGLTVGCCQCHDHKFDPLKQKDYFSLMSFFNQIDESGMTSRNFSVKRDGDPFKLEYGVDKPFIPVASDEQLATLDELKSQTAAARKKLDDQVDAWRPRFVQWVEEMRAEPELAVKRISNDYVRRDVNTADLDNLKNGKTRRLADYFLERTAPWSDDKKAIKAAQQAEANAQADVPLVMIMRDNKPRETFVMLRGNYETLGDRVTPKVPDFLPPLSQEQYDSPNRLTLARWLTSPKHPLTARVMVNRYWQMIFGRGIVSTPGDFGLQGAWPSHPELLDWLAVDFQEHDWNLKRLLRSMVLSKTYRQSAILNAPRQGDATRADASGRDQARSSMISDPDNVLLSRGSRQRLDSRLIRDQALAISGLLTDKIGGPPVFPYQPPGIWESMSLGKNHYVPSTGEDLYRRSLYTVWRRVVAPANFFDVANRQSCSVTTTRTSTPLHALTTLNDDTYVEAARAWATRLARGGNDTEQLRDAFFAATGREAKDTEMDTLISALNRYRTSFRDDEAAAQRLLKIGESPSVIDANFAEYAAWTNICLLILNLDETLSK